MISSYGRPPSPSDPDNPFTAILKFFTVAGKLCVWALVFYFGFADRQKIFTDPNAKKFILYNILVGYVVCFTNNLLSNSTFDWSLVRASLTKSLQALVSPQLEATLVVAQLALLMQCFLGAMTPTELLPTAFIALVSVVRGGPARFPEWALLVCMCFPKWRFPTQVAWVTVLLNAGYKKCSPFVNAIWLDQLPDSWEVWGFIMGLLEAFATVIMCIPDARVIGFMLHFLFHMFRISKGDPQLVFRNAASMCLCCYLFGVRSIVVPRKVTPELVSWVVILLCLPFLAALSPDMIVQLDAPVAPVEETLERGTAIEPAGLRNVGNTCYMNSVLQCLSASEPFSSLLSEAGEDLGRLGSACAQQLWRMTACRGVLSPYHLLCEVECRFPFFHSFRQQDAHELLRLLLHGIADEATEDKTRPPVARDIVENHFKGYLCATTKCCRCGNVAYALDEFLDLSLEIPAARIDTVPRAPVLLQDPDSVDTRSPTDSPLTARQQSSVLSDASLELAPTEKELRPIDVCSDIDTLRVDLPEIGKRLSSSAPATPRYVRAPIQNGQGIEPLQRSGSSAEICKAEPQKCSVSSASSTRSASESPTKRKPSVRLDCKALDKVFDPCFIPEQKSGVAACLSAFCSMEALDDVENLYDCEVCRRRRHGKSSARRRFLLAQCPPLLTINLKRFVQLPNGASWKFSGHVSFPLELSVADFVVPPGAFKEAIEAPRYQLYGVTVHQGTIHYGHYIAYVFVRGSWFGCSDHHIWEATQDEVLSAEAYLLFYRSEKGGDN